MDNERKYDGYTVQSAFKHGDEIWAFACETGRNTFYADTISLNAFSKPVRGVLSSTKYEDDYDSDRVKSRTIGYFIPYKKRGEGLSWSKAVSIDSRQFTETESAAIYYFNAEIDKAIKGCNAMIQQVEERKI